MKFKMNLAYSVLSDDVSCFCLAVILHKELCTEMLRCKIKCLHVYAHSVFLLHRWENFFFLCIQMLKYNIWWPTLLFTRTELFYFPANIKAMKKYFWGRPINVLFKKNLFCKLSEISAIVLILPGKKSEVLISESNLHLSLSKILKAFC